MQVKNAKIKFEVVVKKTVYKLDLANFFTFIIKKKKRRIYKKLLSINQQI